MRCIDKARPFTRRGFWGKSDYDLACVRQTLLVRSKPSFIAARNACKTRSIRPGRTTVIGFPCTSGPIFKSPKILTGSRDNTARLCEPSRRPAPTGCTRSNTTAIGCRSGVTATPCASSPEKVTTGAAVTPRSPSPRCCCAPRRSRSTARRWCAVRTASPYSTRSTGSTGSQDCTACPSAATVRTRTASSGCASREAPAC
jgi:hypothetical protein